MTDTKPLSAEEVTEAAIRSIVNARIGEGKITVSYADLGMLISQIDAARAETAAVVRERDEAHAAFIEESTDLLGVAAEREALRSLAADLVEGLKAATAAINAATQLATAEMAGHDRTAERLDKQIWEAREQSRALLTRAAALGVKPRDGEKEKGNG